jgi:hypothetical protein
MKTNIRDLTVGAIRDDGAVLEEIAPMKGGARSLKWRRVDGSPSYQVLQAGVSVFLQDSAEKPAEK